eukprot:6181890-Pleurochrysis_carterae.AAC.3
MFSAFALFGMIPVGGFVVVPVLLPSLDQHALFLIACAITALALFLLGAYKAKFHDKLYIRSGRRCTAAGRSIVTADCACPSARVPRAYL